MNRTLLIVGALLLLRCSNAPIPTGSPASECDCGADLYDCDVNFTSQRAAQTCFVRCMDQGQGDVHLLDGNYDMEACR